MKPVAKYNENRTFTQSIFSNINYSVRILIKYKKLNVDDVRVVLSLHLFY